MIFKIKIRMKNFQSLMDTIVADDQIHAAWLNTLSLMENCGARKIAAFEHPVETNLIILKHAAEEFRHAYYLKKQISKLEVIGFENYSDDSLLASNASRNYLKKLDVEVCRYLRDEYQMTGRQLFYGAYLLVTYAIEVRADSLYEAYQKALTANDSRVNVKSIIAEEEGHLKEMQDMLVPFHAQWQTMCDAVCKLESSLFEEWVGKLTLALPIAQL